MLRLQESVAFRLTCVRSYGDPFQAIAAVTAHMPQAGSVAPWIVGGVEAAGSCRLRKRPAVITMAGVLHSPRANFFSHSSHVFRPGDVSCGFRGGGLWFVSPPHSAFMAYFPQMLGPKHQNRRPDTLASVRHLDLPDKE